MPATPEHPEALFDGSTDLRVVRLRLVLALIAMFTIPIAVGAPLAYVLANGHVTPVLPLWVGLVALTAALALSTAWLARRVLEPAERLDRARVVLEDAYSRALAESLRDALTGLGNHRAFQEELERQWLGSTRYNTRLALAVLDLDDFGKVNEREGHASGDRVLVGTPRLLTAGLRRADQVFRIGGDEFAVLMPGVDADGAYLALRRVLATALEREIDGRRRADSGDTESWSFTVGIAAVPGAAPDRATLYREAEAAMAYGKKHGRTCVAIYDPERHVSSALDRPAGLGTEVARVAGAGALVAVFQPIYDLRTGRPRGYEGLIRPMPRSGFADAGELFAAAEAAGRTVELDLACLTASVTAFARLGLAREPDPQSLAANARVRPVQRPRAGPAASAPRGRADGGSSSN